MPGVPGRGNAPPKRDSQRRRRNAPAGGPAQHAPGAVQVPVPKANVKWHPVAKRWFESLGRSGQAVFYEPSDWAVAELVAESMSRDLRPQVVGVAEDGKVLKELLPLKGASLAAYLKAFTQLLVTEGERRRARLELERGGGEEPSADVSWIDQYRARESG